MPTKAPVTDQVAELFAAFANTQTSRTGSDPVKVAYYAGMSDMIATLDSVAAKDFATVAAYVDGMREECAKFLEHRGLS